MNPAFIYGTAWKEAETARLAELAIRTGFRAIDTANQRKHYFEAAVGEALSAVLADGVVRRQELFLQTKFTYVDGQDARLPYDPAASLSEQVAQSMASSLDHLNTPYVDSFILHGPSSGHEWTSDDSESWAAMRVERDAGRTRKIGVSNVGIWHLERMLAVEPEPPAFVQNRCFARTGWDRKVRALCREAGISYQSFSLLTANVPILRSELVASVARRVSSEPAAVIFAFAQSVGMIPLTGTSNEAHMRLDQKSAAITLRKEEIEAIEKVAE